MQLVIPNSAHNFNQHKIQCLLGTHLYHIAIYYMASFICLLSKRKWSNIDYTIWNVTFNSQGKVSYCKHSFSLFHQSKDLSSLQAQPPAGLTFQTTPKQILKIMDYKNEQILHHTFLNHTATPNDI